MRNLLIIFVISWFLCSSVVGQTINDELSRLREILGVSADTTIKLASSSTLPDKTPLKIYIATGLDVYVRDRFVKWIEEWNKEEGKKLGALKQVSDIEHADIILSRYTLQENVTTQTRSVVVPGTVYNPATNSTITRPVTVTRSSSSVPVYLYILAKKDNELEILYRESDQTSTGNFKSAGYTLRDKFKKMMKARVKNQKK